jgi:hypothetical protein
MEADMLSIVRRSSFFYVTHFLTFSVLPLYMAMAGRKGHIVFATLMVFIWLPSSVLWSERCESYAFLRLLPIRDRDVVRAKLGLGLAAVIVYWAWLTLLTLVSWGVSPEFFARFSLINLLASSWPLLVALCYLGIWRAGARAMTFPLLTLMAVAFFIIIGFGMRYFPPRRGDFGIGLTAAPWPLQLLLPLVGLALFLWLARLGPRVKRSNDEHLQLP